MFLYVIDRAALVKVTFFRPVPKIALPPRRAADVSMRANQPRILPSRYTHHGVYKVWFSGNLVDQQHFPVSTRPMVTDPAGQSDAPIPVSDAAKEVVDYMLFVGEASLTAKIVSSSGFAEEFAAIGPHDSRGRSLRQLDLERRLMRYPCSYMIYAPSFNELPDSAKDAVYRRMWQILSGGDSDARYAHLSLVNRRAIVEILRATKKDLPTYFLSVTH